MSRSVCAWNHEEWDGLGLQDYGDFSDMVSEYEMGEDAFSGFGCWFYIPDEPLPTGERVIYHGTWGNDNSPGASSYTYAELFYGPDFEGFEEFKTDLESREEYLPCEDEESEDDTHDPDAADDGEIASQYENGNCPDCGETIPQDAQYGEACGNCDHIWNHVQENDDG